MSCMRWFVVAGLGGGGDGDGAGGGLDFGKLITTTSTTMCAVGLLCFRCS